MRRLWFTICVLAALLGTAAEARAGQVVFSSNRCEGPEDLEQRRQPFGFPGSPPRCRSAIWRVNDDGSGLRRLTDGGDDVHGRDTQPTWSPDGRFVAYTSAGSATGGKPHVFIMNSDGSGRRRLTAVAGAEGYEEMHPDWSPDGRRVLFMSRGPTSFFNEGISVALVGTDVVTQIVNLPGEETMPRWSADGLRILFGHHYSEAMHGGEGEFHPDSGLYSVSAFGGPAQRLSTGDAVIREGLFSPDERQLSFEMFFTTWTMNADGSDLRQRTFGQGEVGSTWADGSAALIYPRFPSPGPQSILARLELRDGATPVAVTDGEGYDIWPDWHPGLPVDLPPEVEDVIPPAVRIFDARTARPVGTSPRRGTGAASASARRLRAGDLRYVALDGTGVRRVAAAISTRRGGRCRFMGRRALGRPRRCSAPVWFGIKDPRKWRARVGRLPRGLYRVRFRARDVRGNRRRTRPVAVRVVR